MADLEALPFKVIMIGAGLSGTLLANGLLNPNINFTLYERDRADTKWEGYQIRVGSPALEGMRACLQKPDLERIVSKFGRAAGRKAVAPNIFDREFRPLLDLSAFKAYSKSAGISRVVLRDEMMKQIPEDRVAYERKFKRMEISQREGRERVRVSFEGGYVDEADIVVGADRNHSRINQQPGLNNIAPRSTHHCFISKADVSIGDLHDLPPNLLDGPDLAFGDDLSLYFATLYISIHLVPGDPSTLSTGEKLDILRLAMRDWAPQYHQMLDTVTDTEPSVFTAHVSQRPPVDWRAQARKADPTNTIIRHPRIWLMGDAMHAMLPCVE